MAQSVPLKPSPKQQDPMWGSLIGGQSFDCVTGCLFKVAVTVVIQ